MTTSIYVGNLDPHSTSEEIRALFEAHGAVESVDLITDKATGQSRGFGFVKMDSQPAKAAIAALDGQALNGRNLQVSEARPKNIGGGAGRARGGAFGNGGGHRRRY
ncbi:MAG: RNA-binding protein [Gammaproteobacteria bacterium]